VRRESIEAIRALYGNRTAAIVAACVADRSVAPARPLELLDGTPYPVALARYMIEHEWVMRLDDLVERRLMLLYHRPLTQRCLEQLADVMVEAGLLDRAQRKSAIAAPMERLGERFSKKVSVVS